MTNYPESTVITVSRHAANRINTVYITRILDKSSVLGHVTSDCELGEIPVYKRMRVLFTQNQNKALSIVNGRIATLVQLERNTLFLKLRNGRIVHIHPVSFQHENNSVKTPMPFMPAYALTIPKAQGQTIDKGLVWLDSPVLVQGGGYVALSRNRKLENIRFMVRILHCQIVPVRL